MVLRVPVHLLLLCLYLKSCYGTFCAPNFQDFDDQCYLTIHARPHKKETVAEYCEAQSSVVVEVESSAVQLHLQNILDIRENFFVGIEKGNDSIWRYKNEKAVEYTNWAADEPKDENGNCAVAIGQYKFAWFVVPCALEQGSMLVCQRESCSSVCSLLNITSDKKEDNKNATSDTKADNSSRSWNESYSTIFITNDTGYINGVLTNVTVTSLTLVNITVQTMHNSTANVTTAYNSTFVEYFVSTTIEDEDEDEMTVTTNYTTTRTNSSYVIMVTNSTDTVTKITVTKTKRLINGSSTPEEGDRQPCIRDHDCPKVHLCSGNYCVPYIELARCVRGQCAEGYQCRFSYCASITGTDWAYGDYTLWPELCTKGLQQSPIDISDWRQSEHHPNVIYDHYHVSGPVRIENDGYTVVINQFSGWGQSGNDHRPRIVHNVFYNRQEYILEEVDFHWGATDSYGSEHTINGRRYPLEIHFVHRNAQAVPGLSRQDDILILSVMGTTEEPNGENVTRLSGILRELPSLSQHRFKDIYLDRLRYMLPHNDQSFYFYSGSLTAPPCTETVSWMVLQDPIYLTQEDMQLFHNVPLYPRNHGHNYRPIVQNNGRILTKYN